MKPKILFLVNHDVVIYNFRREIVEEFLNKGYEVIISSPYGERIDELIAMGCTFEKIAISRHGTNPIEDLKLLQYYSALIDTINPSIVLGFTIKPNIYGAIAARRKNIPFVANITGLGTAVENKGILQRITILLYKYAFKDIQTIFFQNKENMQFFIDNNIQPLKHKLLPGSGVNLDHFQLMEYPTDEEIEFLFVSRIMKEKGIDQYIEAAKFFTKKYNNVKFHVCGFCEENYEQILNDLHENGVIFYHGMQKDIRNIIKKTHCTIHPTYYPEGLSNILLESAACGRPIITTNRSGTREVVDDGVNGYLVKVKDADDLIKKIEKFIKLNHIEKKVMGKKGRKKVEQQFDRNIVVEKYFEEVQVTLVEE